MKPHFLPACHAVLLAFLALAAGAAETRPALDASGNPPDLKTLAIGDAAPDFALPGIDGRVWRLADFGATDVLMVLFTSNHCPTSHGIEGPCKSSVKVCAGAVSRSWRSIPIIPTA